MAKYRRDYMFQSDGHSASHGLKILLAFVILLFVFIGGCYLYNQAQNQNIRLLTDNVRVMALDSTFEGFRILHISDLSGNSIGSNYEKWQRLLAGQKWNAVIMSGDMVGKSENSEPMLSLIHELTVLNPDAPIYFVAGDGDPNPVSASARGTPEVFADWVLEAQKAGALYLDAPMYVEVGKHKVWFSPAYLYDMDIENSANSLQVQIEKMEEQGVQYEMVGGANYRAMIYRLETMRKALSAINSMTEKDLQIAVNHIPLEKSYIRNAVAYADKDSVFNFRAVDLVLCGHLCGGQYCLPGEEPIYCEGLGFFPGKENVQGMQRINSVNIYVSPGIASSSTAVIPLRLFCRPSVTILKFTSVID